ncbi:ubiquitin carboxyl-terminal hydrolase 34 isoform X2 [Anthonomus grandis grandis]|uniref:ubiquitin carboxyl-terminal hydrolase 34 isoform X2 n=1 Tax=Anthonomus grandis grandis TaxID=2921223 RepID=UPI0021657A3D|nr:ubiquitin carboxyl-terminal hydrolase 34 isoform X2 [Anthonomus grandis grandis]
MCEGCADFVQLLVSYEALVCRENTEQPILTLDDINTTFVYVQTWPARQCMCWFRDPKNLERFSYLTQGLIYMAVSQLKQLVEKNLEQKEKSSEKEAEEPKEKEKEPCQNPEDEKENMEIIERDKLLILVSKIFLLNFPLYVAFKHTFQSKDGLTQQEIASLNIFCDLHDSEIPIYLLKNVTWFCKIGGLLAMTNCFTYLTTDVLPVSTAHAMISIVCNLKLWMNYKTMVSLLVPLRSCVLRYMCKLSDQDLRTPTIKSMADFMWNAIKDPLDSPVAFDVDGLDLAFKYFTSSTLTMRLAGITQINNQIGVLAEICVGETLPEAEAVPRQMADWLISNNIISHIFGPNLHVEVIKQSHIILNFLAMEGRITCEHMDIIWAAAQLKHCAKPVHDLLPGLVKHLAAAPTLHLYSLLTNLEPKDHSEQTLYLASALIKAVWSRGGAAPEIGLINVAASTAGIALHKCAATSSENSIFPSVSIDASNSEEEQGESTGHSESHKSDSEIDTVEIEDEEQHHGQIVVDNSGPPPCKLARKQLIEKIHGPVTHNSSTDTELDGIPIQTSPTPAKVKWPPSVKTKSDRKAHVRKKLLSTLNALPEGVEAVGSSSSQEEADVEDSPSKMRKRRKFLRKARAKRQKSNNKRGGINRLAGVETMSEVDVDSDHEVKTLKSHSAQEAMMLPAQINALVHQSGVLKSNVYLEESSSCSELGKEEHHHHHHHHHVQQPTACGNYITIHTNGGHILEMLSGEEAEVEGDAEGSYSSRMSNKSEKNMADFDGEDSACEEELAHLTENRNLNLQIIAHPPEKSPPVRIIDPRLSACFKPDNVCQPGNTLLWDLLQDDKICQLGEGLAVEAEKTLCNLICFMPDKDIRMKFIEGCLNNLAHNKSVIVSLRMLPKLLTSFRGLEMHHVTQWAEKQHHMMTHFFNNLKAYTSNPEKSLGLYTHQMQVQVRLHFLSAVFSPMVSPNSFKLSIDQVDTLWECLAHDSECSDELFSWLLSQTKTNELHALRVDALRRLYLYHLPSLPPEKFSMICLSLFQHLCGLHHLMTANLEPEEKAENRNVGMDHMWKIALRANNTDVSMAAIGYINSYYMGQNLQHESQFVAQCMTNLKASSDDLLSSNSNDDASLLCIQRALLLTKTHIETFRKRYAYHLRKWALEGRGIGSHSAALGERSCTPIRIIVQSGSCAERCVLEMLLTDYVADLRAEIVKWWEGILKIRAQEEGADLPSMNSSKKPDTWIRIITQGQELSIDCDEKTLQEMGFKDNQITYISVGMSRNMKKREFLDAPSMQAAPPRDCLPTLLLLKPCYFEQLFSLMHTLSSMKTVVKGGRVIPHTRAQVLSRRVWDILSLMPTSPKLLQGFQKLDIALSELLDPSSAQKLMYSLYIVESLSMRQKFGDEDDEPWTRKFIQHGGLRHLYDIFLSGVLQRDSGDGSDWQQDCLASLLKLLCHLGVDPLPIESRPSRNDKIVIPSLNEAMLSMVDVKTTMPKLTGILKEASLPKDPNHYKTGFWGRAQVVHYAMALLVSWLHSSEEARQGLFESTDFSFWLQRLVLEDPEPAVRREVCSAIYRLCLGVSARGDTIENSLVAPMLAELLSYLKNAESMRPQKVEPMQAQEEGKEPYGPACRDYFWLVSRLVDSLPDDFVKESIEEPQNSVIDINELTAKISQAVLARDYLEARHRTVEDDGLIGLLNLLSNLLKHRPPFQISKGGQDLLNEVFNFLFALPNPKLRHVPKCKSPRSRTAAFDLLVELVKGSPENYAILHEKLLKQHQPGPNSPYPWDYWPHEDGRSECGYVGLTNLGATCYMASCMQHLYMMPQARASILAASTQDSKHETTLKELQRMFAYLLESERKAYNPRSFCKVYTMDHQPLNTAEQKDMAEFFIDLVSKLEEMTPPLKEVIKKLFCGVISNNVVSLDCGHVSRTLEEFYTVRCQVADMRNLYESLDEVTVKDTLEGDNMYTCSQCGKKVRAEKRACFKQLPRILCFNTMRYTFNMLTMLKEKVNTHFSFPLRLNMAGYVEKTLMPQHYQEDKIKNDPESEQYEYDLIGVTVHTGTADGGHYYSFIKDRTAGSRDKWFLFNDAEVKPFDPNQIAAECFGGEMTSKTYDSVTDKFMDFSFEKTNSAYMLFYERCPLTSPDSTESSSTNLDSIEARSNSPVPTATFELSKELEDWIWQDNMHFIQDKNIFEHTYFNFMWQICGYIPQTILSIEPNITEKAAQLSTSFFIETFIHAKEKPTMVQWVELVTKQFNACQEACVWFLEHMAKDVWWPVQVLLKCPNQMVRQMFQRLCIHVIQRLKQSHSSLYLKIDDGYEAEDPQNIDVTKIGNSSCVTKFIKTLLSLMEHGAKAHLKHLTEYFNFLYEFSKMGEEESKFLLGVGAINSMVHFYLGQKANDFVDVSEGEEDDEMVPMPVEKYKPASLDKMITLIASLVEKSRDSSMKLQLSDKDYNAVAGGKGFPFLYQQIKDNINLQQTRNLIHSLCKTNNQLAQGIICMISQAITRHSEGCQPFFKILTLLTENNNQSNSSGSNQPCFTQLVLQKVWEAAECCPHSALDWLALQVTRNRLVHSWVLSSMDSWLEHFLIAHSNQRVRNTAGYLLVSLVPSTPFRQGFRASHRINREPQLSTEAQAVLHQIYTALLRLLPSAKHYTDMQQHGSMKLTTYFALLMYCCISRTEKLMFGQYFIQLWHLFHPKLSEPSIPAYHNKQALLAFWNHVCTDCPENVQLMLANAHVTKNIAFNYILADHDDQEIVLYNRAMLPAYYGLLRMMCQQSRVFTRNLANHQNLQWAFKNITPHPTQYSQAVEELFKLMQIMVMKHSDCSETEQREIYTFKRTTLMTYLQCLDGRTSWGTLINAFRILVETNDDKLYVVYNGGLQIVFECFQNLHVMLHEATACHVVADMLDVLQILSDLMHCIRAFRDNKDARSLILATKDWLEVIRKLATLLNTYNPPEMRSLCIDVLKEFVLIMTPEAMQILVPLLSHCHSAFQDSQDAVPLGPYFPRRGHSLPIVTGKGGARPLRPMVQMTVPQNQLECSRGIDPEYDKALDKFYTPYHDFIDTMFRLAVNNESVQEVLINLSAVVGYEAVPLHSTYFPKLWLDILKAQHVDRKYINMLTSCNYFVDYVEAILLDERLCLTVDAIYEFLMAFFPKVSAHVLSEQTLRMVESMVESLKESVNSSDILKCPKRLAGDIRALGLVYKTPQGKPPASLKDTIKTLLDKVKSEIGKLNIEPDIQPPDEKPSTSKDSPKEDSPAEVKKDNETSTSEGGTSEEGNKDTKRITGNIPLDNLKLLESSLSDLMSVLQLEKCDSGNNSKRS